MRPKPTLAALTITLIMALAACNLPTPQPQVISPQDAINTSAARTVAALSTELAAGRNPTLAAPSVTPVTPSPEGQQATPGEITPAQTVEAGVPTSTAGAGDPTLDPNAPCNRAAFVRDITIPDGAKMPGNTAFVKTWELKNTGSCSWDSSYSVVFAGSGSSMGGPASIPVVANGEVKPGENVIISVPLRAPGESGKYQSRWVFRAPDGKTFGLGNNATGTFFADIEVSDEYNFAQLACSAAWSTAAGPLPCPGGESGAGVVLAENPRLENGSAGDGLGMYTAAQPVEGGYIVGRYPPVMVPQQADFRATLGCRDNTPGCYVRFKVTVQVDGGPEQTLGEWNEGADGNMTRAIADLNDFAGKPTAFNLYVYVAGAPAAAKGLWLEPVIVR